MNQELYGQVKNREKLAALVNADGEILWESTSSPVGALFQDYFRGTFQGIEHVTLYAYQAGIAMAMFASRVGLEHCYAFRMSACGLETFRNYQIGAEYEEQIPLVRSSKDEDQVCPIEKFLFEHSSEEERWGFLKERFSREGETPACSVWAHKKAE